MPEYNQLGLSERETIYKLKSEGMAVKKIAKVLNRHKSTIYRELKRNVDDSLGYLPDRANNMSQERKANHGHKLDRYPDLKKK